MSRHEVSSVKGAEIADRLRLVRVKLGYARQADFAQRLKRSRNSISAYERARALPDAETLLRLAELGICIQWLLTGVGQMMSHPVSPPPSPVLDRALMGRIVDTIQVLYAAHDRHLSARHLGELAADWYAAIAGTSSLLNEQLDLLAERQIALGRMLREGRDSHDTPAY